jgi:hypothetical protein
VLLASGGPRLFARVTAAAQAMLAAAGLLLFLLSPMIGWAATDASEGHARSAWVWTLPPAWFLGVYETVLGTSSPQMVLMAQRALLALTAAIVTLLAMYPLAYARVAADALFGSPIGSKASMGTRIARALVRAIPGRPDLRGGLHFVLLTVARVARQKLVIATAIGAGTALSFPFALEWWRAGARPDVPSTSHIAVPIAFMAFVLTGLRVAYSIPSDLQAAWIFSTSAKPHRVGIRAARVANLVAALMPAAAAGAVYAALWDVSIALQISFAIAALGLLIGEILLGGLEYVPFAHPYVAGRARLQARWPVYFIAANVVLQLVPYLIRELVLFGFGFVAAAVLFGAAVGVRVFRARQPEPLDLVDPEGDPDGAIALHL